LWARDGGGAFEKGGSSSAQSEGSKNHPQSETLVDKRRKGA